MITIAQRGSYKGRQPDLENTVSYIDEAIAAGYDVQVDAWLIDGQWMLGETFPKEKVELSFFERPRIWTKAMNLVGYVSLYHNKNAHVVWQHKDDFTFTSKGIKWANAGYITHDGIIVEPDEETVKKIHLGVLEPLGVCCSNFDWLA